jgi:adenylate cyclase
MDRRLTAILAADVVGYSRLMGRDEAATLDALNAHRRELIDQKIAEHHGRIVKLVGDGILAEFPSVVNAVACAADIQRGMLVRNLSVPDDRRIVFRIGVNLGDVIVEGEDIFGDGVNVAARLEGVAKPGGIAVSGSVRDQVGERLALIFEDSGEHTLKNIERPIRVFHVRVEEEAAAGGSGPPPQLAVPNKPSIAVLPFTNMSGDPEQEYFADGLVEDVITNLSKMPGFFVIARNSTFAYKGRAIDVRRIAAELGVRYVLEGSVRRAANRVRITGQLIEGAGATHVWADKFEGSIEDIFDLQDRLTESIVGALEPTLRRAEIERARSKRPDTLDAYDFFLRALPHTFANTLAETNDAIDLLGAALRIDPNYAVAHAYAAWSFEQRYFRGGFNAEDRAAALKHAGIALNIGNDDPQTLAIAAFVHANITKEYDSAIAALDRALEMNPNSALALGFSAVLGCFGGHFERAIDHAQKALRLSPFDPLNYHSYLALAWTYLFTGRIDESVANSTLAIQANPGFSPSHAGLVAGHVNRGQIESARAAGARLLEIAPGWTVGAFEKSAFVRPELMHPFAESLRKAGLPE